MMLTTVVYAEKSIIIGYELDESGDLGPGSHTLYSHSAQWIGSDYAPGGFSSRSLFCDGNFQAVVGPVATRGAELSWVTWLKIDASGLLAGQVYYASTGATSNSYGDTEGEYRISLTTDRKIEFGIVDSTGSQSLISSSAPPMDTWVHLAVIYDNGTLTMYFDNSQVATMTIASSIATCTGCEICLGTSPYENEGSWHGGIDEFAIFDHIVTPTGIQMIIDEGLVAYLFAAETGECNDIDTPYKTADFDENCVVDIDDFLWLAGDWLDSTEPVN